MAELRRLESMVTPHMRHAAVQAASEAETLSQGIQALLHFMNLESAQGLQLCMAKAVKPRDWDAWMKDTPASSAAAASATAGPPTASAAAAASTLAGANKASAAALQPKAETAERGFRRAAAAHAAWKEALQKRRVKYAGMPAAELDRLLRGVWEAYIDRQAFSTSGDQFMTTQGFMRLLYDCCLLDNITTPCAVDALLASMPTPSHSIAATPAAQPVQAAQSKLAAGVLPAPSFQAVQLMPPFQEVQPMPSFQAMRGPSFTDQLRGPSFMEVQQSATAHTANSGAQQEELRMDYGMFRTALARLAAQRAAVRALVCQPFKHSAPAPDIQSPGFLSRFASLQLPVDWPAPPNKPRASGEPPVTPTPQPHHNAPQGPHRLRGKEASFSSVSSLKQRSSLRPANRGLIRKNSSKVWIKDLSLSAAAASAAAAAAAVGATAGAAAAAPEGSGGSVAGLLAGLPRSGGSSRCSTPRGHCEGGRTASSQGANAHVTTTISSSGAAAAGPDPLRHHQRQQQHQQQQHQQHQQQPSAPTPTGTTLPTPFRAPSLRGDAPARHGSAAGTAAAVQSSAAGNTPARQGSGASLPAGSVSSKQNSPRGRRSQQGTAGGSGEQSWGPRSLADLQTEWAALVQDWVLPLARPEGTSQACAILDALFCRSTMDMLRLAEPALRHLFAHYCRLSNPSATTTSGTPSSVMPASSARSLAAGPLTGPANNSATALNVGGLSTGPMSSASLHGGSAGPLVAGPAWLSVVGERPALDARHLVELLRNLQVLPTFVFRADVVAAYTHCPTPSGHAPMLHDGGHSFCRFLATLSLVAHKVADNLEDRIQAHATPEELQAIRRYITHAGPPARRKQLEHALSDMVTARRARLQDEARASAGLGFYHFQAQRLDEEEQGRAKQAATEEMLAVLDRREGFRQRMALTRLHNYFADVRASTAPLPTNSSSPAAGLPSLPRQDNQTWLPAGSCSDNCRRDRHNGRGALQGPAGLLAQQQRGRQGDMDAQEETAVSKIRFFAAEVQIKTPKVRTVMQLPPPSSYGGVQRSFVSPHERSVVGVGHHTGHTSGHPETARSRVVTGRGFARPGNAVQVMQIEPREECDVMSEFTSRLPNLTLSPPAHSQPSVTRSHCSRDGSGLRLCQQGTWHGPAAAHCDGHAGCGSFLTSPQQPQPQPQPPPQQQQVCGSLVSEGSDAVSHPSQQHQQAAAGMLRSTGGEGGRAGGGAGARRLPVCKHPGVPLEVIRTSLLGTTAGLPLHHSPQMLSC